MKHTDETYYDSKNIFPSGLHDNVDWPTLRTLLKFINNYVKLILKDHMASALCKRLQFKVIELIDYIKVIYNFLILH